MTCPTQGGCWYCFKEATPENPTLFSWEWDTEVHLECVRAAAKDKTDPEAQIFAREFKELLEQST